MQEEQHHIPRGGWIAAAISAVGAALFFLWQPIMDYFVSGTYDENITVQIEANTLQLSAEELLLDIQVKASNRGNVPVKLISESSGDLVLEIRQITKADAGKWVNPLDFPVTAKKTLVASGGAEITVAPGSYLSREVSIALPKGTYWIEGTLHKKGGESLSEATYFQLGKSTPAEH